MSRVALDWRGRAKPGSAFCDGLFSAGRGQSLTAALWRHGPARQIYGRCSTLQNDARGGVLAAGVEAHEVCS